MRIPLHPEYSAFNVYKGIFGEKIASVLAGFMVLLTVVGCSSSASGGNELVVGIDDKFAPMGFRDESNEIVGFDIDYARTAEKMGKEVKFQPIDWKSKESELSAAALT